MMTRDTKEEAEVDRRTDRKIRESSLRKARANLKNKIREESRSHL
jgi:hypothetical protein